MHWQCRKKILIDTPNYSLQLLEEWFPARDLTREWQIYGKGAEESSCSFKAPSSVSMSNSRSSVNCKMLRCTLHFMVWIAAVQQMGITHILMFAINNRLRKKWVPQSYHAMHLAGWKKRSLFDFIKLQYVCTWDSMIGGGELCPASIDWMDVKYQLY